MLVDFSVTNFGPYRKRNSISMRATKADEHPDNVIDVDGIREGLLTSSIVFGSNASGKSCFLKAIDALQAMLHRPFESGYAYPWYEPFRLSKESLDEPVEFALSFLKDGELYHYCISYDRCSVVSESLFIHPNGRPKRVFERDRDTIKGGRKAIAGVTTSSTPYLTTASIMNDDVCARARRFILEDVVFLGSDPGELAGKVCGLFGKNQDLKELALSVLNKADFSISGFSYDDRVVEQGSFTDPHTFDDDWERFEKDIFLAHDFSESDVDADGQTFELGVESQGTQTMFGLTGPLIDAMMNGKTLVIDEFGAFLHPLITRWIVGCFSGKTNANHAQLIADSHDLGLMDIDELLRRDQIWFANRSRSTGESELYSLSDFKGIRKDADVLKAYLAGRFDAVPNVSSRGVL